MSNPAQEEADRLFSHKTTTTSHPEDKGSLSETLSEDEKPSTRTIRSSRREDTEDQDTDDEELAANMVTTRSARQNYTIPSTTHFANTGPKGVIADAQNYQKARQSTFRRTLHSISDTLSFGPRSQRNKTYIPEKQTNGHSSGSELDLEDEDDDFMHQWRQQRLAELQEQYSSSTTSSNNNTTHATQRRTYGTLDQVNATGYLNAIEKAPHETHVVVLIFDPESTDSRDIEDELKTIAYKWNHIRFVKLHHQIAEMESVEIPAILAYRGGDVFATISGVEREGLEGVLRGQGVLVR